MTRTRNHDPASAANPGFEAKLWLTADKLRNNMDAAEYKHVVLGLIFLKYISDTFEEHHARLLAGSTRVPRVGSGVPADPLDQYAGVNPEDPDEYKAENVFWVPAEARWSHFQASAKQPTIGKTVDDAMVAIRNSAFDISPVHHVAPHGMAGFVLANGSMSSNQSGAGDIRRALIEADLVDCMVALPGQLFYSTQIPVCLWFLAKNKGGTRSTASPTRPLRDRRKQTLFIDARKLGTLIDRVHRELTDDDLEKITSTYHAWRSAPQIGNRKSEIARTSPASANPPPPPKPPRKATSSRPAATSAPRKSKTTAITSRKRCRASSPNCTPSSPSPRNSKPLYAPTYKV